MLEILATVVLLGLMLVPMANIAVGAIAGYMLYGVGGALAGAVVGSVITSVYSGSYRWG